MNHLTSSINSKFKVSGLCFACQTCQHFNSFSIGKTWSISSWCLATFHRKSINILMNPTLFSWHKISRWLFGKTNCRGQPRHQNLCHLWITEKFWECVTVLIYPMCAVCWHQFFSFRSKKTWNCKCQSVSDRKKVSIKLVRV